MPRFGDRPARRGEAAAALSARPGEAGRPLAAVAARSLGRLLIAPARASWRRARFLPGSQGTGAVQAVIATDTRALPGVAASAAVASDFVHATLAAAGCADSAAHSGCVADLVSACARYAGTTRPGGTILLRIDSWQGGARIEVRHAPCGPETPADRNLCRAIWAAGQAADTFGFSPGVAWCQFSWPGGTAVPQLPPVAGPARRLPRHPARLRRLADTISAWWHSRRYGPVEAEARLIAGMPRWHPESFTRRHPDLAELAGRLWPGREYEEML